MAQTSEGAIKGLANKAGVHLTVFLDNISKGMKWCYSCSVFHPVIDFGKDSTRYDGLTPLCVKARSERRKSKYVPKKQAFHPMKGKKMSEESRQKMRDAAKKRTNYRKGWHHSLETRLLMSRMMKERTPRGENHYAWKGGTKVAKQGDRGTPEYRAWRKAVFERDEYTCLICRIYQTDKRLEAHHIKSYAEYPELRYDVDNGATLCQFHHQHEVHDRG